MIMESVWDWFPQSAAWLLIFVGLVALTWMGYERKRKGGFVRIKKEEWEREVTVTKVLRILSYVGIFVGVLTVWAAFLGLFGDIPPSFAYRDNPVNLEAGATAVGNNNFTSIILIVLGLVCILKPLSDVPWASLIGLIGGILLGIWALSYIPVDKISYILEVDARWIYLVVFIVIGSLVGLAFKFWTGGITALAKFLSYPVVALIVAIFCFVQGIMLLVYGTSLVAW